MIKIININFEDHLEELKYFFKYNVGSSNIMFTYFNKRNFECIKNHLATFLIYFNNEIAGYSHLDKEKEKIWLGICIGEKYKGKKLGDILLEETLKYAENNGIKEVLISVYKDNHIAINLYKKKYFIIFQENENSLFMKRKI